MSTAASSPPSSSSGFRFPKKETPNAHPYAIKTTSTALLSRSNSSSSHASAHHYVPTSPSPTSGQHSPTKHHRPSRHRYSRSLTSDAPLPLPPPPNSNITSSSPSPSPVHRQYADEDDDTPRRRVQRAETLPSSVGAPVPTLDLPDDPKTWTPSQLSSYLASTLQAGDASLPTPVSKDISKFIKENRITGRVFLRLSDEDLEQFGINKLWRATLLASSRSLRQSVLRGRIWGFGNAATDHSNEQEDEEDTGNLSSSSSNLGSGGLNGVTMRRSRHSSNASSTSERGRVRDMIDSLEKTSLEEEGIALEYGRRSISPTKRDSFSSNHYEHRHPSASPPKPRTLPQRGAVNNLFAPAPERSISEAAVDEKEGDATITNVARRNVNGREPRMLPFPPNQVNGYVPSLTPSHTGATFPLPHSPQQTGNSYASPPLIGPASDYELGFKQGAHSPSSQVFVVRHNPSPFNGRLSGDSKGKRLLPYPPVTAPAQLHHPRPRRLVGTNTGVADLGAEEETGYESGVEGQDGTTSATSGTDGYNTAFETQSEGESVVSNGTVHHQEEEELSMQALLAGQPIIPGPITGVEAWEMELGDTVKRIGGGADPHANGKNAGSVSEIGRKTGRNAGTTGARRKPDGVKRDGLMGLFSAPVEESPSVKQNGTEDEDRARLLDEREATLSLREQEVQRREEAVSRREDVVTVQEIEMLEKKTSSDNHWTSMNAQLATRDTQFEERDRALQAKERALSLKEAEVSLKETQMLKQEQEARLQLDGLNRREAEVQEERVRLGNKERVLDELAEKESIDAALWPVPVGLLRKCWGTFVLPIVGEERTPGFLSTKPSQLSNPGLRSPSEASTSSSQGESDSTRPAPYQTSPWNVKRDAILGRRAGGGYLVLMSIGVCVVVLRALGRRAGGVVGGPK